MPNGHDREYLKKVFREARYTQDSPILPEVWLHFLEKQGEPAELLLTPHREVTSVHLLQQLRKRLEKYAASIVQDAGRLKWVDDERALPYSIYCNEAVVGARLRFDELLHAAIPLTPWWWGWAWPEQRQLPPDWDDNFTTRLLSDLAEAFSKPEGERKAPGLTDDFVWFAELVGHISYLFHTRLAFAEKVTATETEKAPSPQEVASHSVTLLRGILLPERGATPSKAETPLWSVSKNRTISTSIFGSTKTVKADAAKRLFQLDTSQIAWAVIDSGVDARHPAFGKRDNDGRLLAEKAAEKEAPQGSPKRDQVLVQETLNKPHLSRVEATFDFTRLPALLDPDLASMGSMEMGRPFTPEELRGLRELKRALRTGRSINWEEWMNLLQIPHDESYVPPQHPHGTHVAGILAADWRVSDWTPPPGGDHALEGVCPDLRIYDLRVLSADGTGSEYTVMAALQFVRHLNAHKDQPVIHGVNLSLSTPHDVANFACGRTPVCDECERLVGSGVVVVAAAGNSGYRQAIAGISAAGYQESTITDPGNSELVITVGSTHRLMPHAYGVSYFSSRGPTGDGRYKPDVLAPGEKIKSPIPDAGADTMDGTSMAAPHVSGAAALLMARHVEFIGQPARVKEILCKTATDLGRDRYYQGYGIVDILRAIQSV